MWLLECSGDQALACTSLKASGSFFFPGCHGISVAALSAAKLWQSMLLFRDRHPSVWARPLQRVADPWWGLNFAEMAKKAPGGKPSSNHRKIQNQQTRPLCFWQRTQNLPLPSLHSTHSTETQGLGRLNKSQTAPGFWGLQSSWR